MSVGYILLSQTKISCKNVETDRGQSADTAFVGRIYYILCLINALNLLHTIVIKKVLWKLIT